MFSTLSNTEILPLPAFNLSSTNAFNLVQPRKLSFGRGLRVYVHFTFVAIVDFKCAVLSSSTLATKASVLFSIVAIVGSRIDGVQNVQSDLDIHFPQGIDTLANSWLE